MAVAISNLSATFANSSITYNAISMNVTTVAYEANSKFFTLKANGVTKFSVDLNGHTIAAGMNLVPTIQAAFDKANTGGGGGSDIAPALAQANAAYNQANTAYAQANTAFNRGNTAYEFANTVFGSSNAVNSYVQTVGAASNTYAQTVGTAGNSYTQAVGTAGNSYAQAIGTAGNSYTQTVGAASNAYAVTVGTAGNAYAQAVGTAGNAYTVTVGTASNSYAQSIGTAANLFANAAITTANLAFDKANAANVLAFNTGAGANAYAVAVGAAGNAYTQAVGTAGNSYAQAVGTAGNAYTVTVGTAGNSYTQTVGAASNAYAVTVGAAGNAYTQSVVGASFDRANSAYTLANAAITQANTAYDQGNTALSTGQAAFAKANAALANTTGTFAGALTVTSDLSASRLLSTQSAGDEGGEIVLATAQTNNGLSTSVTIDIYQNKLRFFETGGTNRGAFINLASAAAGVSSDLLAGGSAIDTVARETANAGFTHANAAFAKANAALPNTSGVSFAGDLNITGNTTSDRIAVGTSISSTYRLIVSGTMALQGGGYRVLSDVNNQNLWRDAADTTTRMTIGYNATAIQGVINVVNTAAPLVISTSNAERMRIDPSGNVIIGTTASSSKLLVEVPAGPTATPGVRFNSSANGFVDFHNSLGSASYNPIVVAGDKGIIFSNGTANTGTFVIAPWNNGAGGGLKVTPTGNVTIGRTADSTVGNGVGLDIAGAANAASYLVNGTFLGHELLTTLSATGVATQTPTGLTLTGYRMLLFDYNGISHDNASNRGATINGQTFGGNRAAADLFYGLVFVSLISGRAWGVIETDGNSNSTLRNLSLTNANTSFTVGWNGAGNFDAGSIRVYGVR